MAEGDKEAPTPPPTPPPSPASPEPKKTLTTAADADEDIPHPTMELYRHTMLRGANLGSVLSLVLAPPYLIYKGVWRQPMEFVRRTGSITAKGMALGIAFGIVSTYLRIRNDPDEMVFDRCYRLRYNKGQVRTDKFTYGGLVLGGIGGMAAGLAASPVVAGINGASLGAGLAVFAHVLTKKKEKKEEKKEEKN